MGDLTYAPLGGTTIAPAKGHKKNGTLSPCVDVQAVTMVQYPLFLLFNNIGGATTS